MRHNLTINTQDSELSFRCECGATVIAHTEEELVDRARLHFGEFHPDLGEDVPADLILAMAEAKEGSRK